MYDKHFAYQNLIFFRSKIIVFDKRVRKCKKRIVNYELCNVIFFKFLVKS